MEGANNQLIINEEFLKRRLEAYKKMFPNLDCLGWYSTGSSQKSDYPKVEDLQVQKSIQRYSENPIYLIMNTESQEASKKKTIPIFLFETNHVAKRFESLEFTLA